MTERPSSPEPVAAARSALFVPGDRPERFDKALASGADLVIVDLEDAVAVGHKAQARDNVVTWLSGGGRAAVRINGLRTEHCSADRSRLAGLPGLQAVVVPMAEDPAALAELAEELGGVAVVAMVETAAGLLRAHELAETPGVVRLAFGHLDLAADLDSADTRVAMLHARSILVVTSRAAGLPGPLEGVTPSLGDPARWADDARYAAELGFSGKLVIHPGQVEAVNAAFTPTAEEVARAARVLEAAEQGGAVRLDGEMVDAPVLARARRLLARARRPVARSGR
jgi:citrate lyase subunit beta/citryl-CoA lyase